MPGIYELLLNAVEHGHLGINSEEKTKLLRRGDFGNELTCRMALPEYREKYVEVTFTENHFFLTLCISDHGNGFDWKARLNATANHLTPYGRGLLIAQNCGFDRIVFNAQGNSVTCLSKNTREMQAIHDCSACCPCGRWDCALAGYCEVKNTAAA